MGLLAIDLHTRRRNRLNGTVVGSTGDGNATIQVDQSFGNCPKCDAFARVVLMLAS